MQFQKAIEVAREHGDLKENAEYHAAKERQGHIEGRILELKDKLGRAEVIDCSAVSCDRIIFGTVVTVEDLVNGQEIIYQLLGPEEADVKKGSISVLSPWGRAMIGKSIGDEFEVKTPSGVRPFRPQDSKGDPQNLFPFNEVGGRVFNDPDPLDAEDITGPDRT